MRLVINSVCVELFLLLVVNNLDHESPKKGGGDETFEIFSSDDSIKG